MAIYQYHIIFIPKDKRNEIPFRTNESFDDIINSFWKEKNYNFNLIESKLDLFTKPVEWSKNDSFLKNYGDSDTNDVHFWIGENRIILEFSCRFDLRELDFEFVKNVLQIANSLNSIALDSNGNIFELKFENLIQNMKKSKASKFVKNPSKYFDKL